MFRKPKFQYSIEKNTPGIVTDSGGDIALTNNRAKQKRIFRMIMKDRKDDAKYFLMQKRWRFKNKNGK